MKYLAIVFCMVAGYGCTSRIIVDSPKPLTTDRYNNTVTRLADSLLSRLSQKASAPMTIALTDFTWEGGEGNARVLIQALNEDLTFYFDQNGVKRFGKGFSVVERRYFQIVLNQLKFESSDLINPVNAKKFGEQVGANVLMTGSIYRPNKNTLKIKARFISVSTGRVLSDVSQNVDMDSYLLDKIGEKVPGQIVASAAQKDISLLVDSKSQLLSDDELRVELEAGKSYQAVFTKPGYKPLVREFTMRENSEVRYRVSSTLDRTLSLKCFVLNVVPGLGALIYNESAAWASAVGVSSLLVYTGGVIYLADIFGKPGDFFDSAMETRYENRLQTTLYMAMGIYGFNLIMGLFHGLSEVGESKRVILESEGAKSAFNGGVSSKIFLGAGSLPNGERYPNVNIQIGF
jgi:hypothetical protein